MTGIFGILSTIQKELKATKDQKNDFGGYTYRSCESILEAVKKLLPDGCSILLSDVLVNLGDRYYVEATARLIDASEGSVFCVGYAREAISRKGFGEDQLTGAASSYARKYALNGLFAIDDNKDSDTNENRKVAENSPYEPTEEEDRIINDICHLIKCGQSVGDMDNVIEEYKNDLYGFGIEGDKASNDICQQAINQTCEEMKDVWEAGNQAQSYVYKFNNVKHALDSFVEMCTFIDTCDNPVMLEAYAQKWSWRIAALKDMLDAKTHEKDGVSPHGRLVNLYKKKTKELSNGEQT